MYLQSPPGRLMQHGWSLVLSRRGSTESSASPTSSPALCRSSRARTAVVHNGVELRAVVARNGTTVRIGIVGRLDGQKQHLVLLEGLRGAHADVCRAARSRSTSSASETGAYAR
jgi:hypothetical protein